ncbi:PDZ domain, variant 3 [Dermatophagoides farinae]|uniref:PDZ domain, variant 3 n=1 Tax=Dermatophagoides farinae TaxID=6954 RepID=A0A922HUC2_DERFA|nr:PDZ domain, variant 3 [Dermatophagoides farinae]
MNGPLETATLPPLTTTPIQSNGSLFSSYYHPHQHQLHHHHHHHNHANHYPLNGHYHLYPSSTTTTTATANGAIQTTNGSHDCESLTSLNDGDIHVTVLQIDQQQQFQSSNGYHNGNEVMNSLPSSKNLSYHQHHHHNNNKQLTGLNNSDFVTVLTIVSTGATILTTSTSTITTTTTTTANQVTMNDTGSNYNHHQNSNQRIFIDNKRGEIEEEVIIYRLPGERLGMALRFDGGQSANETIRRVFVQSITLNSPSAKAIGLMLGMLREGDEILHIDGRSSSSLTRLECITLLRDAPVCIRLFVRRRNCSNSLNNNNGEDNGGVQMAQNCQTCPSQQHPTSMTTTTMTTMTTVAVPKVSNCCQMPIHLPNLNSQYLNSNHNHLNNNNDVQNRLTASSLSSSSLSLSSSTSSSLISATNTPLLTQLLNSCSDQSIASSSSILNNNKKVPPPVPPRMATTTLSSKRKPRPMPIPPPTQLTVDNPNEILANQHHQIDTKNVDLITNQSSEQTMIIKQNNNGSVGYIEQHGQYSTPIVHQQQNYSQPAPTTQQQQQSIAVIEKPPRRKNFHSNCTTGHQNVVNGNPPPLPPRRPKGPPPKPPIDRIQSTPSIVNVVNLIQNGYQQHQQQQQQNQSNINISNTASLHNTNAVVTTAKSLPSLVTVIHSPTNSNLSKVMENHSHTSIKPTPNNTAKVSFNISNSKVSSFIRQTAEKLHRKLSGKAISTSSLSSSSSSSLSSSSSSSNGESDEEKDVIMNSINKSNSSSSSSCTSKGSTTVIVDLAKTTIDNKEEIQGMKLDNVILVHSNNENNKSEVEFDVEERKPTTTTLSSSTLPSTTTMTLLTTTTTTISPPPPTAASYSDFNHYSEESFESDTDDTSSSVSTIIERGPYCGNNSFVEHTKTTNVDDDDYDIDNLSIVDRVLSPFEKLDNKDISPVNSKITSATTNTTTTDSLETNLSAQSYLVTNLAIATDKHYSQQQQQSEQPHHQLSSDKTDTELINDDEQLMMMIKTTENDFTTANEPMLIDADRSYSIDASPNCIGNDTDDFRRDHLQASSGSDGSGGVDIEQSVDSSIIKENNDDGHSDDEDLIAIKNDLFSRLDDDKDDFMIDTDYLNESSSRFMFHHNSSELILNSYSELSSITEEDEDDDNSTFEMKCLDNGRTIPGKQQQKPVVPEKPIIGNIKQPVINMMNNEMHKMNGSLKPILITNGECQDNRDKEQKLENLKVEYNDNEVVNRNHSSDCDSSTSSSTSESSDDQTKVSLDNVFEFLNKATDDFEFVERMLELTNDKIDSIDDIMRIRESLRGLQESDQRENLQRFLDGKDVFEELIALSSPSSTSSSQIHNKSNANVKRSNGQTTTPPTHNLLQMESSIDFASLPVCLSDQQPSSKNTPKLLLNPPPPSAAKKQFKQQPTPINKSIMMTNNKVDQSIDSKIPTLFPITLSSKSSSSSSLNNLNKRSQSISNIFSRSTNSTMMSNNNGSFNSLIETKPSLIPRPISNFNLSLPQSTLNSNNLTNVSQQRTMMINNRITTSHNCLNRSTSMQSIFSTNSLSRSTKHVSKIANGTLTTPRRQSSTITSGLSTTTTGKNYHHNCLNHNDGSPPYGYGSLSRLNSKSSTNVYNTGSLPRPINNKQTSFHNLNNNNRNNQSNNIQLLNHHDGSSNNNRDFRTTSLTDLTYGATRNNPARRIHTNARKKHSCLLYAPNNSNRPPPLPSPIKPIKPKPIPVVTEIRTYCPNINNNNSIINGDGNCKKIEQESDDDNNNNNGGKKRIIVIKNHCTIKPPVATFKSKKFEEIF